MYMYIYIYLCKLMTQQWFPENNWQPWSKKAALTISFSNVLYLGLNQIKLICSLIHLQASITLTDIRRKRVLFVLLTSFQKNISEKGPLFLWHSISIRGLNFWSSFDEINQKDLMVSSNFLCNFIFVMPKEISEVLSVLTFFSFWRHFSQKFP